MPETEEKPKREPREDSFGTALGVLPDLLCSLR